MRKSTAAMKTIVLVLAAVLMLSSVGPLPAIAQEPQSLEDMVSSFIAERRLNENKFSVAYYNTVTGETYMYNENHYFNPASIYKLPLNMYYYEQEAAGNISSDKKFAGIPLSSCHYYSLQYSNNPTSQAMKRALGTTQSYKSLMAPYGGMTEEELGSTFYSTGKYNARFILGTLQYLYDRSDFFEEAIGYLKEATPGRFFECYIPDSECVIAQKYGWLDSGICHTAGIVYTEQPYLLVVFTSGVSMAANFVGEVNKLFYDYTLASQAAPTGPFADVPSTAWYSDCLECAVMLGLINGTDNGLFFPERELSLAEAVKLACMIHKGMNNVNYTFEASRPWYQTYVDYAKEHEIIDDSFDDFLRPATREEAACFFSSANGENKLPEINSCIDIKDLSESDESYDRIAALYRAGVITGTAGEGLFLPKEHITRAMAATIVARLADPSRRVKTA